jgi:TonB family protein
MIAVSLALALGPFHAMGQERATASGTATPNMLYLAWRLEVGRHLEDIQDYPEALQRQAKRLKRDAPSGRAKIAIEFEPDGQVRAVTLLASSGHSELDAAALSIAKIGTKFPRPPDIVSASNKARIEVVLNFEGPRYRP